MDAFQINLGIYQTFLISLLFFLGIKLELLIVC